MLSTLRLGLAVSALLAASSARAASTQAPAVAPAVNNDAFLRAAVIVATFDQLATACDRRGGLSATDARSLAAWQATNGLPTLRTSIQALSEAQRTKVERSATQVVSAALSSRGVGACAALVSLTKLPDAQIATHSPHLLTPADRSGAAADPPAVAAPATAPTTATGAPGPTSSATSSSVTLLAQIDSFGFDTRLMMGVGGFLTTNVFPVVLFKNGDVLRDVEGLAFAGGLAAHRRAKPNDWTRWRRNRDRLEIENRKGWEALPFQTTYTAMPPDFRLDGRFRSVSGTGTVAIGGTDAVTAWRAYTFTRDGRILRGSGAGAQSANGDGSVVATSVAPNQRGRYRIDGLTLHITYDDGSVEQRVLITDPKKPTAIWIDGVGYVQ